MVGRAVVGVLLGRGVGCAVGCKVVGAKVAAFLVGVFEVGTLEG